MGSLLGGKVAEAATLACADLAAELGTVDAAGSLPTAANLPAVLCYLCTVDVGGRKPITLPNGEVRRFLEDGDEVVFRARAERAGCAPIGFGECRGVVLPART